MGWSFTRLSKEKLTDHLKGLLGGGLVADELVGNELWCVVRGQGATESVIVVFLLEGGSAGWGYKRLAEEEHPYYYGCPRRFLKMAPCRCAAWRQIVLS